jgi:hypothetical protein
MIGHLRYSIVGFCVTAISTIVPVPHSQSQTLEWSRQLGTSAQERSTGVAADLQGNVILAGVTFGNLARPNSFSDAFVAKYDANGQRLWTRQLGTDGDEEFGGVTTDVLGNVIVSGYTGASLGGPNAGEFDAYLAKYSPSGQMLWTRQFGTGGYDTGTGVTTDVAGNIYQAGYTTGSFDGTNAGFWDAYLRKTDAAGNVVWTRQIGTAEADQAHKAATDGQGNIYLLGGSGGALPGATPGDPGPFLCKYDENGNLQWTRQFGRSVLGNDAIAADALGNVFVSGSFLNASSGEGFNAILSKFDSAGTSQWTRQLGTNGNDRGTGVATDGLGNAFLSGWTSEALAGPIIGGTDAFLAKYDSSGNLRWSRQFGSTLNESDGAASADGLGNVFISGTKDANLTSVDLIRGDAYLVKFAVVPEPSSGVLCCLGLLVWSIARRRTLDNSSNGRAGLQP